MQGFRKIRKSNVITSQQFFTVSEEGNMTL